MERSVQNDLSLLSFLHKKSWEREVLFYMSRKARARSESGLYHVVLQGSRGACIFEKREDKLLLIDRLMEYKTVCRAELFAFSVFDNHAHLVVREGPEGISSLMRRITVSFAHRYKKLHPAGQSVFRDRYRSEPIELWELPGVISYVENEPVRLGLCLTASSYPFGSAARKLCPEERLRLCTEGSTVLSAAEPESPYGLRPVFLEHMSDKYGKSEEEARAALKKRIGPEGSLGLHRLSRPETDELIRKLRFEDHISIRLVSSVTGIGRGIVQRVRK